MGDTATKSELTLLAVHACVLGCFQCVQLFATVWTVAETSILKFSAKYWSGICIHPQDLPSRDVTQVSCVAGEFLVVSLPVGQLTERQGG